MMNKSSMSKNAKTAKTAPAAQDTQNSADPERREDAASATDRHHDEPHQALRDELEAALNAASLHALSGRIELSWGEPATASPAQAGPSPSLRFAVEDGAFEWLPAAASVDVTFYFNDASALRRVLGGEDNPMDHFMRGDFRSSGYLLWTFPLLTLFRGNG